MKTRIWFQPASRICRWLSLLPLVTALGAQADQVDTVSGDHYVGRVISMNASTVVLQSDVLGTIRVPRGKVSAIQLGTNTTTAAASSSVTNAIATLPVPPKFPPAMQSPQLTPNGKATIPNSSQEFSNILAQLSASQAMANQVKMQMLAGAGPGATGKFDELLGGLTSGRISLDDLRAQAKTSADQIRALQKELGGDAGGALDGYLNILENFVHEADQAGARSSSSTNSVLKLLEADP